MENYIIELNNVTVRFNMATEKVDNLKEYFVKLVKRQLMFQEFLALEDINLQIRPGEAWALIGTNGAGKSTMLKLISGILEPYKGTVKVNGTIAPLIELGAGFDMNLTARENIFLNGTLLGHTKKFMEEHFDEIVDFAELRDFLDVPLKNYSSGMQARIGFAIATMVRPDILIVDEILAVGDLKFQEKCKERMRQMLDGGTTLLFVSHNIDEVRTMCDHAIWIEHGKTQMTGSTGEVCDAYINGGR
jgi:lipopolysaccharide transport system ATP-binding protein